MQRKTKTQIICIEEHYWDPDVSKHFSAAEGSKAPGIQPRLHDLGDGEYRLREMDEAGIDFQVLSHGAPSTQKFDPETAVTLARAANDKLARAVRAHPDRLAAFAALPTPDPMRAADELARCVGELGFKGAMIHGLTNQVFHDDKRFWPIYARAQALDVPIYLHPGYPHPAVVEAYFKDYIPEFPMLARPAWGYTMETATIAIRMVLSGVFDEYPKLRMVLGHMGESIPFSLWRIDQSLARQNQMKRRFRETFCEHFWITTSGNFSTPALICSMLEMGSDRILFSVDWPFVPNEPGVEWIEGAPISEEDRVKLMNGNAKKLLKLT